MRQKREYRSAYTLSKITCLARTCLWPLVGSFEIITIRVQFILIEIQLVAFSIFPVYIQTSCNRKGNVIIWKRNRPSMGSICFFIRIFDCLQNSKSMQMENFSWHPRSSRFLFCFRAHCFEIEKNHSNFGESWLALPFPGDFMCWVYTMSNKAVN